MNILTFYDSSAWKHKRSRILRRDGYRCQECKRYGRSRQADTVHHIYPLEFYPDRALLSSNLISLCNSCHNEMHDRDTHLLTEKGIKLQERMERKSKGVSPLLL
ncbi:MAG: HNH endonuclease [Lachnospiraceae bacterium]|nr:HNH endonuclease [Lachnospiraceae bacterium]